MRIASGGAAPATGVPAARVIAFWTTVRVSRSMTGAMSGANWCGETSAISGIMGFLRLLGDDREPSNEWVRLGAPAGSPSRRRKTKLRVCGAAAAQPHAQGRRSGRHKRGRQADRDAAGVGGVMTGCGEHENRGADSEQGDLDRDGDAASGEPAGQETADQGQKQEHGDLRVIGGSVRVSTVAVARSEETRL